MTTIKEILENYAEIEEALNQRDSTGKIWATAYISDINHLISLLMECKPYVGEAGSYICAGMWDEANPQECGECKSCQARALLSKLENL